MKNSNPLDHYSEKSMLAIIIALVLFTLSIVSNVAMYRLATTSNPIPICDSPIIIGLG